MDYTLLNGYSIFELRKIAKDMDIRDASILTKSKLIRDITTCFKYYEKYSDVPKEQKDNNKYTIIKQIGNRGKEGIVYLVKDKKEKKYALKQFKQTKSGNTLKKEAELQQQASKYKVCPKVIEYDVDKKYIVMELLNKNLIEELKEKGELDIEQQREIIQIFRNLDNAKVFHGDANILNFMLDKKGHVKIIDFGFSKPIDDKLIKEHGTDKVNMKFMVSGLLIKLKELTPHKKYDYLIHFVPKEQQYIFNI